MLIKYSVENKKLKKHQASSNNLNYFTHVKTKVPSTTIKVTERGQLKEGEEPVIDEEVSDDSGRRWSEEKMILCVFFVHVFCACFLCSSHEDC